MSDCSISTGCSWLDTTPVQRYDWLRDSRPSAGLMLGEALDTIVEGLYAEWIARLRSPPRDVLARNLPRGQGAPATIYLCRDVRPDQRARRTFSPT